MAEASPLRPQKARREVWNPAEVFGDRAGQGRRRLRCGHEALARLAANGGGLGLGGLAMIGVLAAASLAAAEPRLIWSDEFEGAALDPAKWLPCLRPGVDRRANDLVDRREAILPPAHAAALRPALPPDPDLAVGGRRPEGAGRKGVDDGALPATLPVDWARVCAWD
jgi:hypothetical protein